MSRMDFLRQGGTPFDGFLYATVGEDRGGNTVSVLSALARLGLDPWDEAADLANLPREGARDRLGALMAGFGDVPALGRDQVGIIPRLVDLLPKASDRQAAPGRVPPAGARTPRHVPIIIALMAVLFLAQFIIGG